MLSAEEHADLLKAAVGLSAGDEFPIQAKYNPKHFEVEDDRDERLRSCGMVDTEAEPRFDAITKYALRMTPFPGGRIISHLTFRCRKLTCRPAAFCWMGTHLASPVYAPYLLPTLRILAGS